MISRLIQPNILLSIRYLNYNNDYNSMKSINSCKTTQNNSSNTNEPSMAQIPYSKITSASFGLIRIDSSQFNHLSRTFSQ